MGKKQVTVIKMSRWEDENDEPSTLKIRLERPVRIGYADEPLESIDLCLNCTIPASKCKGSCKASKKIRKSNK